MNFEFFSDFGYIAKNRNLTTAAREIGTTQPVLSKRLASAERELGVELVERCSGVPTVSLTPAGETFLEASLQISGIYSQMCDKLARQRRGALNTVRVGASMRQAVYAAEGRIRSALVEKGDGIELKWVIVSDETTFDALRSGRLDVAIEPWSAMADTGGLADYPLYRDPALLVVNKDDPLARRETVGMNDMRDLRFLSVSNQTAYAARKHLHSAAAAQGWSPLFESVPCDSTSIVLIERLRPGHVAIVPSAGVAYYQTQVPDARFVPIDDPALAFDMRLFWADDPTRAVREVVHAAREVFLAQA